MKSALRSWLGFYLRGMAMGAADVVPGVSGGTIAFIAGIYERLIHALSHADARALTLLRAGQWRALWRHLDGFFLSALFLGIATSVLSLAGLIAGQLAQHPQQVWGFFFGLVAASCLLMRHHLHHFNAEMAGFALVGLVGAVVVASLPQLNGPHGGVFLFFAGVAALCAMVLPGISGAFVLVLLGAYGQVLQALHHGQWAQLWPFMAGALLGLLGFARILKWLFARFHQRTTAALLGFVAGSLWKIWPWTLAGARLWPWQVAGVWPWLLLGLGTVGVLARLARAKG